MSWDRAVYRSRCRSKRQKLYTGAGAGARDKSRGRSRRQELIQEDMSWRHGLYTKAGTGAGDWSSIQEPGQKQETGAEYGSRIQELYT